MAYLVGKNNTTASNFKTTFKASAGQTSKSFLVDLNSSLLSVYRNGVLLYPSDYSVSGNTITFNAALELDDEITVESIASVDVELSNAVKTANTIIGFDSTGYEDGDVIYFRGRDNVGDGGGGQLRFLKDSTATANGVTAYSVNGGRLVREGWSVLGFNGEIDVRWAGAYGSGDDTSKVQAALAAGNVVRLMPNTTYSVTGITIPTLRRLIGGGETTVIKWGGSLSATGQKVISAYSGNPANALANILVSNLTIDLNNADGLTGLYWVYASVQSAAEFVKVINVGTNCTCFYFSKTWYASFTSLSVRASGKPAGSVAFKLDTAIGQINANPFKNLQANGVDIAMLIDSSGGYLYDLFVQGTFENNNYGVKFIQGYGVRSADFHVYFESNSTRDIYWPGTGSTDITQQVTWSSCTFNPSGSSAEFGEGQHRIIGSDRLASLVNNTGAYVWIDGNPSVAKSGTATSAILHYTNINNRNNAQSFSSAFCSPLAGATASSQLASGTAAATFALPTLLLANTLPAAGYTVHVRIAARRTYNAVEKYTEAYITKKSDGTWAIAKTTASSTEDSTYATSVNSSTGAVTVDYNAGDTKIVSCTWTPLY